MEVHTQLTPTQRNAIKRRLDFRESIAARAAELADRKANEALRMLRVVALETPLRRTPSIQTIAPEAMPAETDPPSSPNWFVILASEPVKRDYPSIRDIQKAVCKHYGVTLIDILSSGRSARIALPRQVAYYFCKELTLHSLPQIGRRFGDRDHSSIHHGIAKIKRLCPRDADLAHDIATLTTAITGARK